MLCHVILCYIMVYVVILCYSMVYHVMCCCIMLYYVMLCYVMLYHGISCCVMRERPELRRRAVRRELEDLRRRGRVAFDETAHLLFFARNLRCAQKLRRAKDIHDGPNRDHQPLKDAIASQRPWQYIYCMYMYIYIYIHTYI